MDTGSIVRFKARLAPIPRQYGDAFAAWAVWDCGVWCGPDKTYSGLSAEAQARGHADRLNAIVLRNTTDSGSVVHPVPEAARALVDKIIGSSNEVMSTSDTGGQKGTKPERYDLIPSEALEALAVHYGRCGTADGVAPKYEDHNWRRGYEFSKSYAALMRHLQAWQRGVDVDEETGSLHMTAVAWHSFALISFALDGETYGGYDDRYIG